MGCAIAILYLYVPGENNICVTMLVSVVIGSAPITIFNVDDRVEK